MRHSSHPFISHVHINRWAVGWLALMTAAAFVLSACAGKASPTSSAGPAGTSGPVSFSKDVQPILQNRCVSCHGGQRTSRGLDMTSYNSLMAGSDNGPVVVAGDPANSLLIQMVQQGKMPKNGAKLLPSQLQILTDWIAAGAPNN